MSDSTVRNGTRITLQIMILSSVVGFSFVREAQAQTEPGDLFQRLTVMWEANESSFGNARIQFLWFDSTIDLKPLAPEDVEAIFHNAPLSSNPQSFREYVPLLFQSDYPPDGDWLEPRTLTIEGERFAEEGLHTTHVGNGKDEVYLAKGAGQVDIYVFGDSRMYHTSFRDIRFSPSSDMLSTAEVVDVTNGEIRIAARHGVIECVVDKQSSIVLDWHGRDTSGETTQRLWQRDLVDFGNGMILPQLVIESRYTKGQLSRLRIIVVEDAEFDVDLPDTAFALHGEKRLTVVDHRASRTNPRAWRLTKGVTDVAAMKPPVPAARKRIESDDNFEPTQSWSAKTWLVLGNLLAVAFVVLAVWLRRLSEQQHSSHL